MMKWAGAEEDLGRTVLPELERLKDLLPYPLGPRELAGNTKSAERFRKQWI